MVDFNAHLIWGSTTSISSLVQLHAPMRSQQFNQIGGGTNNYTHIGDCAFGDESTALYSGVTCLRETTVQALIEPRVMNASGTYLNLNYVNATAPHTWATGDTLDINGTYNIKATI